MNLLLTLKQRAFFLAAILAVMMAGCRTIGAKQSGLKDADSEAPNSDAASVGEDSVATGGWATYCQAGVSFTEPVEPKYSEPLLLKAAKILSAINSQSYYLYPDVLAKHATPLPPEVSAQGVNKDAHNFLSYLCGEFRDSSPMLVAKLNWIFKIRYLNTATGTDSNVSCANLNDPLLGQGAAAITAYDPNGSPWKQLCIGDYNRYLRLSETVFNYRQDQLKNLGAEPGSTFTYDDGTIVNKPLKIGDTAVDRYVPGYTVCETKYIFANYVKKKISFALATDNDATAYKRYTDGYASYKANCTAEDLDYYYDFRGDSNFKPNSPESNGMIWFARTMAKMCLSRTKATPGAVVNDADCQRYYEEPFKSRYNAARAGLGAWMLHAETYEKLMNDFDGTQYDVVQQQSSNPNDIFGDHGPYLFRLNDQFAGKILTVIGQPGEFYPNYGQTWNETDLGMATVSGLTGDALGAFLFRRINNAVDRHTDWYKSGFDNAPTLANNDKRRITNSQAYSPFVASSYEMSKSNGFTGCGPTIPCNNNPAYNDHRHWMFIFKIKKENWVRPEDLADGHTKLDFDRMWFDETSFGDSGLANDERAWDRLGSPREGEFAEILYLYRIPNGN